MTLPPDVEAFIASVRSQADGMLGDVRVPDGELQWHRGFVRGALEGVAVALGVSSDAVMAAARFQTSRQRAPS